ncbi:hypothetical protein FGO68_gene266 [Halteria grandinella]|uniref:Uncharacterized protein n=1 Tax=Halteria grandinella TaxID=5974 RepID=A0A8J8NFV8_HALGN|nr:hypothetical protein FGO68_gene266 [Halteria grandinella]
MTPRTIPLFLQWRHARTYSLLQCRAQSLRGCQMPQYSVTKSPRPTYLMTCTATSSPTRMRMSKCMIRFPALAHLKYRKKICLSCYGRHIYQIRLQLILNSLSFQNCKQASGLTLLSSAKSVSYLSRMSAIVRTLLSIWLLTHHLKGPKADLAPRMAVETTQRALCVERLMPQA